MKTKDEILKRIVEINDRLFSLDMIEHWEENIKQEYNRLLEEKQALEKELERIENE